MEKETIKITILGQEREITLDGLIKIYEAIGDPNPEGNARKNFENAQRIAQQKSKIAKLQTPDEIFAYVETAFKNDYDQNFDTFGGSVGDEIFELAEKLPLQKLVEFAGRIHDTNYSQKLQAIIAKKQEQEKTQKAPEAPEEH